MGIRRTIAMLGALLACMPAMAGRIVIDVEEFAVGDDVQNAIAGVKLHFDAPSLAPALHSRVLFITCVEDERRPPGCDRKSFGSASGVSFQGSTSGDSFFTAVFEERVSWLRIEGFSSSGSYGVVESRILGADEAGQPIDALQGYEVHFIDHVGGVDLGVLHAGEFTLATHPRTVHVGSYDTFYPTRLEVFVPSPPGVSGVLCSIGLATVLLRRHVGTPRAA